MRKILLILLLVTITATSSIGQLNKRYFYYIGQELLRSDRYRDAIDVLTVLLRQDTTAYEGYFLRGVAKYNLNDLVGAESDFTAAIAQNSVYTTAYQYRAISRAFMGDYDGALTDFDTAIDIRPDLPTTYYSRGMTYLFSQRFENAISDFDYYIRKRPDVIDGYINRGTCYLMLKDTTRAYQDFDKAVKVNMFSADGYLRRGNIHLMRKDYDEAFNDLNKAIEIDSTNIQGYFNRALASSASHRPVDAITDLSKVIELDSTSSLAYFNRAILYSQIGSYHQAKDDYTKVTWYSPYNVLGYYNRAGINIEIGELEQADTDLTKAIELYPDFANAYLNRSHVRYLLGDMHSSKRDKEIADQKIAEYRSNMTDSAFSHYADTSKVLNKLLSFDSNSIKEFENVKAKDIDIKLMAMYRVAVPEQTVESKALTINGYSADIRPDDSYRIEPLSNLIPRSDITGLEFTRDPRAISNRQKLARQTVDPLVTLYEQLEGSKRMGERISDFDLGVLAHQMKQYTLAMNHLGAAISSAPNNPFLYMNRAAVSCEMIDFIASIDGKRRLVIENDPVNELKNQGRKYNYNEPLSDINKAIELRGDVAYFYYNRANIYCMMGAMPEAIQDYTKALELYPNFADALYNRGLIQLYLKDTKKGSMDMSRAGELGIQEAYTLLRRYVNNPDYKD